MTTANATAVPAQVKVEDLAADQDQQAYLNAKVAEGWKLLSCVFITDTHTEFITGRAVTLKVFRHFWIVPAPRQVSGVALREG